LREESLWRMVFGMTKIGRALLCIHSLLHTRDIQVREGGEGERATGRGCFQILLPNAETKETLRPDPVFSLLLLFQKRLRLSQVECVFVFFLRGRVSLPFRHRCEKETAREKQHGENLMASRGRMTSTSRGGAVGLLGGAQGVDRGREKSVNELDCSPLQSGINIY